MKKYKVILTTNGNVREQIIEAETPLKAAKKHKYIGNEARNSRTMSGLLVELKVRGCQLEVLELGEEMPSEEKIK